MRLVPLSVPVPMTVTVTVAVPLPVPMSVAVTMVAVPVVVLKESVGVLCRKGSHANGWIGGRAVCARHGARLDVRVFVPGWSAPEGVCLRRYSVRGLRNA